MSWKLLGVKLAFTDFSAGTLWGTNVVATFRLAYSAPLVGGKFKELPRLDWHETIMMNEHHKGETWVFETNMYTHNPLSRTLEVWPQRYIAAHNEIHGGLTPSKGYAKLLTKSGGAIKPKDLVKATDDKGRAESVRKYLSSKSGVLEIQIHDIPSINKPKAGEHKERLLLFNIGLVGGGTKVKAYQYLDLDGDKPASDWVRQAGKGWGVSGLKTTGLKSVGAPAGVTAGGGPNFGDGECW